jgi:hypothetical protein
LPIHRGGPHPPPPARSGGGNRPLGPAAGPVLNPGKIVRLGVGRGRNDQGVGMRSFIVKKRNTEGIRMRFRKVGGGGRGGRIGT